MIELPESFLAMPRWWTDGREWLDGLPQAVDEQCERWELRIAGEVAHGSNAMVIPVERGGVGMALRMAPPGDEVVEQARALRWWDGRGTVRLYDVEAARGAMLLELLGESLGDRPVGEAVGVLGGVMRRLAVEGPKGVKTTQQIVRDRSSELEGQWAGLGRAFERAYLEAALEVSGRLAASPSTAAVNGDLHSAQVLRGQREEWLVVDPVLLRGDVEFDLGRVLWTRLDELADDREIRQCFDSVVRAAELDRVHARDWVVFRTVDYWLWGLGVGLTEDPVRCRRLLDAVGL